MTVAAALVVVLLGTVVACAGAHGMGIGDNKDNVPFALLIAGTVVNIFAVLTAAFG